MTDALTRRRYEDAVQEAARRLHQRHADGGDPFPAYPRTKAQCTAWGLRTGYEATIIRFAAVMRRKYGISQ